MALDISIAPYIGNQIHLKVEKLMYDIERNVNDSGRRANQDSSRIMDNQASLISISINGILSTDSSSSATTKMMNLITAARTWWLPSAQNTEDISYWSRIKWHDRNYQPMMIERLEITDIAETDDHEYEYSIELKCDTRTY